MSKAELIMTVEEMRDRDKWLAVRNTGIGGSDASIILGFNNWKTPFALWMEKIGQAEPESLDDVEYIYWGRVLEQLVADRFVELTGKKVRKCGLMRSSEHPFMLASVDRLIVGENAGLECKTTASFKASEWEGDKVPASYYCQCMHYMAVTGADRWYIAVLIGGNKFVWKTIERNEEEIEALIAGEKSFWEENVVGGEMPEVDGSEQCSQLVTTMFRGGDEEELALKEDDDILCREISELTEQMKQLETELEARKNKLKLQMGDHNFGRSASYNIWYKAQKKASRFDKKQFAKDYPSLCEKYTVEGGYTRVLRIKERAGANND